MLQKNLKQKNNRMIRRHTAFFCDIFYIFAYHLIGGYMERNVENISLTHGISINERNKMYITGVIK